MSQNNSDNYSDNNENILNTINSWDDLDINPQLLRGIYAYGFEKPSPIQRKSICPILEGKDVIAQAQSGTGKTACFTISSLELVDINIESPQVIIMSPTRELSCQIKKVLDSIGINIKKLRTQLLVGGTSTEIDVKLLKETQLFLLRKLKYFLHIKIINLLLLFKYLKVKEHKLKIIIN